MEKVVSRCWVVCSERPYYPADCAGCPAIEEKVFWLQYTGGDVCDIYRCCAERGHTHCGQCGELPCHRYFDLRSVLIGFEYPIKDTPLFYV